MPPVTIRAEELERRDYNQASSPAGRLRHFALTVDPEAATVTWTPDRERGGATTYPLGLGTAGAAVGLRRVRYRTFFGFDGTGTRGGKLLLVDAEGRALASTVALVDPVFDLVFPPASSSIDVPGFTTAEESYATTYRLNRAHPGAARAWPLTSSFPTFLGTLLAVAALLTLVAVVVGTLV